MKDIKIGQAMRLTAPCPFALLSTRKDDGTTNLAAVSWWTFLSTNPATLGVCLSRKGLSGSLIEKTGEFGLSIVGEELRESALRCGQCSGRSTDKAAEFAIRLEDAAGITPKLVAGSRVQFECRLTGTMETGDHVFYAAEVTACRGEPSVRQLFAYDGYSRLDTAD